MFHKDSRRVDTSATAQGTEMMPRAVMKGRGSGGKGSKGGGKRRCIAKKPRMTSPIVAVARAACVL